MQQNVANDKLLMTFDWKMRAVKAADKGADRNVEEEEVRVRQA